MQNLEIRYLNMNIDNVPSIFVSKDSCDKNKAKESTSQQVYYFFYIQRLSTFMTLMDFKCNLVFIENSAYIIILEIWVLIFFWKNENYQL